MVRTFIAATLCMAIVACAGKGSRAPVAASSERGVVSAGSSREPIAAGPETGPQTGPMPGDPKAEIEEIWNDIEIETKRIGLSVPAQPAIGTSPPAQPMSTIPRSTDASCKHSNSDTCTQSCTLSDSICTNADKICKLAAKLQGDDWAAGKCTQAKQSCDQAHESCCTCK